MSNKAGFIAIAPEPVANYAVDALDPNGTPAVDLEFLRMRELSFSKNMEQDEVATVLPSFSQHPRVEIPKNLGYNFESAIYEARNSGSAGGEEPAGFSDFLVAAGFDADLPSGAGAELVLTPSTQPQPSLTIYRWERVLHGSTPLWTLWRARGCRNQTFQFGGSVNGVATFSGTGMSANFPRDATETAQPHGRTKPLEWFDIANQDLLLDQYGDAVVWTGSWSHALYTPMVTTFAQLQIAGSFAAVQDWTITIENQMDERPLLVGGVLVWEQLITGRTISFEATLKDRTAYLALVESVRDSLSGTPGDELITLTVAMDDGKGTGGTSYDISTTLQFADPQDGDSNGGKNWSIAGRATPNWSTSFAGDDELSIAISETA